MVFVPIPACWWVQAWRRGTQMSSASFGLVFALAVVFGAGDVLSCSRVSNPQVVDPAARTLDKATPSIPVAVVTDVRRGRGPKRVGGTLAVSSCDGMGSITLRLSPYPTDDRSSAEALGFSWRVISGVAPDGLAPADFEHVDPASASFSLHWGDGNADEQEPVDFVLALLVRDRAGNVSESAPIAVRHPGSGSADCH